MNIDQFDIRGIEVKEIPGENGWPLIIFRDLSNNFLSILKWNPQKFDLETFLQNHLEKFKTLLYHRIKFEDKIYENDKELGEFINSFFPSRSPNEKLEDLLEYLHSRTSFDGESKSFSILDELDKREIWRKLFFTNKTEFWFYLENLKEQELITWHRREGHALENLRITLSGLTKVIQIKEKKDSRFCFVAMSFSKELEEIYDNAIRPALIQTGFDPLIISKEHVDSDKTITDAIIAAIKKSRFTIADFTEHKAGVYFEAGFALGRGQKVIYTCRQDQIDKVHFDTRNFQHIVWENTQQLKSLLIDKIEAYIIE